MSYKYIVFFSALVIFSSCKNDTQQQEEQQATQEENSKIKFDDSELAVKLYRYYTDNPQNQDQIDENAIIEYALSKNLNVERSDQGYYYIIKEEGIGPNYVHGQPCKAHYSGYFLDGKIFDSSYTRGKPLMFSIGQMNPSWNIFLKTINSGTKATLITPSRLAYGERGFPGYVPPNTPIAFDIETMPLVD